MLQTVVKTHEPDVIAAAAELRAMIYSREFRKTWQNNGHIRQRRRTLKLDAKRRRAAIRDLMDSDITFCEAAQQVEVFGGRW